MGMSPRAFFFFLRWGLCVENLLSNLNIGCVLNWTRQPKQVNKWTSEQVKLFHMISFQASHWPSVHWPSGGVDASNLEHNLMLRFDNRFRRDIYINKYINGHCNYYTEWAQWADLMKNINILLHLSSLESQDKFFWQAIFILLWLVSLLFSLKIFLKIFSRPGRSQGLIYKHPCH